MSCSISDCSWLWWSARSGDQTETRLALTNLTVTDRDWDFGSRNPFQQWFVDELVDAYEAVAGRPGLFRFTQMRAELRR